MEIAAVVIVLLIVGLVVFFVMRSNSGSTRSFLSADSLRAKFGTTPTDPQAATP